MKQWQKYAAELLGTFVLVFGGSLSILSGIGAEAVAFGFGLSLLAGLYAFGEVSGGHFNPVVSLAMFLDGRLKALDTVMYWISQLAGALLASLVIFATWGFDTGAVGSTANRPGRGSDIRSFIIEIVATAIFVALILQVTKSGKFSGQALLVIPLTLAGLHFATVGISSTGLNPWRSFAPVLWSGDHWSVIWIYLLAPIIGAVLGFFAHIVTVKGDTNIKDDLQRAMTDMKTVDMDDVKAEIPGQGDAPSTGATA